MPAKLTPKQARFVSEYLIDSNATQAAIRAGYSEATANQQGPRLLVNVGVRKAIGQRQTRVAAKAELTLESHLRKLAELADLASEAEQFSAAVAAETNRGKAAGLYVERQEVKHKGKVEHRVVFQREGRRITR